MAPSVAAVDQSRLIVIEQLASDDLNRLCQALEAAGFLSPAPGSFSKPANNAFLLDHLRHPKANRLIQYTADGAEFDISVFTVKELRALALHLQAPVKSSDKKNTIVASITDSLAAPRKTQAKQASADQASKHSSVTLPAATSHRPASSNTSRGGSNGRSQILLPVREVDSANQHSSTYTTAAGSERTHATALRERQQPGTSLITEDPGLHYTQQVGLSPSMPHRNRDPVRSMMQKLFGRAQPSQVPGHQQQQVAALEKAYAACEAPQPRAKAFGQRAGLEHQRATLQQQWELQEKQRVVQADQWTGPEVVQFVEDVKRLHTKGKGQIVPETSAILQRLQLFPDSIQGFEALKDKPVGVITKGSNDFGSRAGFVVLLRGPEQYLTKGPGHIYVYFVKEAPHEYKVGVCKDLPERRVDSGKLVGRVVNQRKRNHKEYLLSESFAVPHQTLVDEVLKIRLKSWNYHHPDKGDGYTEWFRSILIDDLKDHIRDVIRIVTALYP